MNTPYYYCYYCCLLTFHFIMAANSAQDLQLLQDLLPLIASPPLLAHIWSLTPIGSLIPRRPVAPHRLVALAGTRLEFDSDRESDSQETWPSLSPAPSLVCHVDPSSPRFCRRARAGARHGSLPRREHPRSRGRSVAQAHRI